MKISEAIKKAIDSGSEINAYGCYLLALELENATLESNRANS